LKGKACGQPNDKWQKFLKLQLKNITQHLKNVYEDGEIDEISTCKEYLQVQTEGKRKVRRKKLFYNLDAILSVG
jgi:hypothetical protein